jgi:hypothetical protein
MSASRLVLFDRICVENGIRHLLTAPYSPTTTGRWSGCTRRCAASCSTSTTGAGARSVRRRRRWTGGSTSTTPTGHTDPSAADHRSSGSRWPGSVSTRSATTMRGLPLAGLRLRRRGRRGVAVGGPSRADPAGQAALPGWGAVRRSAGRGRPPGRAGRDPARRSPRGHACATRSSTRPTPGAQQRDWMVRPMAASTGSTDYAKPSRPTRSSVTGSSRSATAYTDTRTSTACAGASHSTAKPRTPPAARSGSSSGATLPSPIWPFIVPSDVHGRRLGKAPRIVFITWWRMGRRGLRPWVCRVARLGPE